jgi:acetyl coenzyme A synthetase (ADP forming)-like protein
MRPSGRGALHDLVSRIAERSAGGEPTVRVALESTEQLPGAVDEREHGAETGSLRRLLNPEAVAVVGAGRDPAGLGYRVMRNLVEGGFPGAIYPVNPQASRILGVRAYPTITAAPGPVDLAVVATPAPTVCAVARDCAAHGVTGLAVITAGFAEIGPEGAEREAELVAICRAAGMRLIGPNCVGVINTHAALNASFIPSPLAGHLGVMSQSGALGVALLDRARALQIGLSSFVSVGNKADVSGNDLLEYWQDDQATGVIGLYLESFGNPYRFGRIARRLSGRKPVIAIKSGRSTAGDRAVRSHTAAAATPDVAVDALLRGAGVIRVDTLQDLLDTARLLGTGRIPEGGRVAIVGNSGGPEALAADACERAGLVVAELSAATQARVRHGLRERLRSVAAVANPVDLTAEADMAELTVAMQAALADREVDALLVVYTPLPAAGTAPAEAAIADAAQASDKTVLASIAGHDGTIQPGGIPSYAFPEQAARTLRHVVEYARRRAGKASPATTRPHVDTPRAREIVTGDLVANPHGRWLDAATASRLLRCYGVRVAESICVDEPGAAAEAAALVGLPAVLKATGPALVHKSDVDGVRLGLRTPDEVGQAYRDMAGRLGPAMTGAVVQLMSGGGVEIIIGAVAHPAFGPLVMVGMGGVTAELLADHTFRIPPVTPADAAETIRELRCSPVLFGYRGRPALATATLEEQIVRVSRLVEDLPEIAELDLNPVIVTAHDTVAVDARVRLAPAPPHAHPSSADDIRSQRPTRR